LKSAGVARARWSGLVSHPWVERSSLGSDGGLAAEGVAPELEAMGVVDEAVEDGVGEGGVADHCRLPLFRMGRWLGLASLIRIIHSLVNALI